MDCCFDERNYYYYFFLLIFNETLRNNYYCGNVAFGGRGMERKRLRWIDFRGNTVFSMTTNAYCVFEAISSEEGEEWAHTRNRVLVTRRDRILNEFYIRSANESAIARFVHHIFLIDRSIRFFSFFNCPIIPQVHFIVSRGAIIAKIFFKICFQKKKKKKKTKLLEPIHFSNIPIYPIFRYVSNFVNRFYSFRSEFYGILIFFLFLFFFSFSNLSRYRWFFVTFGPRSLGGIAIETAR